MTLRREVMTSGEQMAMVRAGISTAPLLRRWWLAFAWWVRR